jgi:hypothetical protein
MLSCKRDEVDGKLKTLYYKYQGQLYKSSAIGETRKHAIFSHGNLQSPLVKPCMMFMFMQVIATSSCFIGTSYTTRRPAVWTEGLIKAFLSFTRHFGIP